jgi:hypothetical protein
MTRILLLGLDPDTVDYSDPALPPGMTAEKDRADITVALKQFTDCEWESDVGFFGPQVCECGLFAKRESSANDAPVG